MLKAAVVGGPSLVFTRKLVVGETRIRSHQHEDARLVKRILGYDANSLYPSTMMKEMPCGPGFVTTHENPEGMARVFPQFMCSEKWFGFAEVDIEVPRELWPEFEEFPPLFVNRSVPDSAVPKHKHDYLKHSGRKRFPEQPKLLGVLSAKKILLYAPLLHWYLANGLKLTAVYRTIDYEPRQIFSWFVKEALLAEVFKLLGNSAYVSSSRRWSGRTRPCTPAMRTRWTNISARPGSKTSRRSVMRTRSSCARASSPSTAHSKWESWSTSWRSSACSSSTTSSWTSTSIGETSSSSRWIRTACTSPSPTRSSRTPSSLATSPSSRRRRSSGWPGTSGATASPACSSSRRRPPVVLPFAASATT